MERRRSSRIPKPVIKPQQLVVEEQKPKRKRNPTADNKKKESKKPKMEPPPVPEIVPPERIVDFKFIGDPIPRDEALRRWPGRYDPELIVKRKKQIDKREKMEERRKEEEDDIVVVKCHYSKAEVDGTIYELDDDVHVVSDKDLPYIGKIIEFFETVDGELFCRTQWYYRPSDTVVRDAVLKEEDNKEPEELYEGQEEENAALEQDRKEEEERVEEVVKPKKSQKTKSKLKSVKKTDEKDKPKEDHTVHLHEKRIFSSILENDNHLDLLFAKIKIARIASNVDLEMKEALIASSDYFYDMEYELSYKSFVSIPPEDKVESSASSELSAVSDSPKVELSLLDLYSGCGAMSTGLTLGADVGGVKLVTRWAVDVNKYACETLKLNHPDTKVRNERAEDFLSLLQEWQKLCQKYLSKDFPADNVQGSEQLDNPSYDPSPEEARQFVVESLLAISYGDPSVNAENMLKKADEEKTPPTELHFKVRWKGYDFREDTWESISGLTNCEEQICQFVKAGYRSKLLPLPGDGISGFNRFRNDTSPLEDEKNYQMLVYMNIVKFLNPDYILMENVVDLVKFADGFLARYAVRRLISMDYQVRIGIVAAGSFGLPQFRMRVFVWGARMGKKIPPYPYPTHEVVVRGNGIRKEFEQCLVAYDENTKRELIKPLALEDALTDLPKIKNSEKREKMLYDQDPITPFQKFIRLSKIGRGLITVLNDHTPLELNKDDYERVRRIPQKKEACFSHLGGVIKDKDGKWMLDPKIERVTLKSGKFAVPDYALSFTNGKSTKPFRRLWWDETVPTVVTRAEPHNQAIMHPEQDRVLSVRENARLQGFPDYYELCGSVKEKYIQVGNAVAVPVAKALGYTLSLAVKGLCNSEPLVKLPDNFSFAIGPLPAKTLIEEP
ncbi:hypothetical protein MKW94_001848 [Papaver nudicaule]|uniref:DNA (cytosine-5-)-methyltransferase n=1 Tax=Papaver nudicaule TaxID=74823 RepID=A0AA41VV46_PAPNU|nr:hypothetical protein [Papaver nudicaule]